MEVNAIKRPVLVNSALSPLSKPPAGLAFLCGVCEIMGIDYMPYDINIEFLKFTDRDIWNQVYANNNAGEPLDQLPMYLQEKINAYIDYAVDQVLAHNPDCIGMTITTFMQQEWAEKFLRSVRKKSNVPVIAGGPGVGVPYHIKDHQLELFGTYMVKQKLFDYYILGEGDLVLQKFLQGERDNIGLNGHDCMEHWQPQIDNLDLCPKPSYQKINLDEYDATINGHKRINITGSRGCVRRCTFCDVGHLWKKFRQRSVIDIVNEMVDHYRSTGATSFYFTDSLVNGSIKQFMIMLENIVNRSDEFDNKRLLLSGTFIVRPKQSHPERMFELMHLAGFEEPLVGIESGSESVREHLGKKFSNEDIQWHFEMSEKYKLKNWLLMIVGYPTETEQDFQATKDLLIKNQKYVINQSILGVGIWGPFTLLPNTPLNDIEDLGLYHMDQNSSEIYFNWQSTANPGLTLSERNRRFLDLLELAVNLRYPLPVQVQHYFDYYSKELTVVETKRVIPIQAILS